MKMNNLFVINKFRMILWLVLLIRLAGAGQVAYYLAPQGIATDGAKEWSLGIRQAMLSGTASLTVDEWNRPALALNGTEGLKPPISPRVTWTNCATRPSTSS